MIRASILLLATAALAACSANPRPRLADKVIDRALAGAPGEAQPSKIVATEIAFARAAKEDGQWTAFRAFAAPGAMIHGRNGAIPAEAWLATQEDPPEAVQWAPREIWMSCDARVAVSTGRFRDPEGIVGTFITVWERQSDGEYRWIYDSGMPDDPQPPAREKPEEGDIVVTAMDAVRGHVADCRKPGDPPLPPVPEPLYSMGTQLGAKSSPDGTLVWRWVHVGPGEGQGHRLFSSQIHRDGTWEGALNTDWAPIETVTGE